MEEEKTLNEKAMEQIDKIAYQETFNAFKVMKNGDHEIRHSNTLAWLFDKKENHGLDNAIAIDFFSTALSSAIDSVSKEQWEEWLRGDYTVQTEVPAENKAKKASEGTVGSDSADPAIGSDEKKKNDHKMRIDILVVGKEFTCTIENKYGADTHDKQCLIYRKYIKNKYKDKKNYFIYLDITSEKYNAIKEKEKDKPEDKQQLKGYELFLYKDVLSILENHVEDIKNNKAQEFLNQYIETLKEKYGEYNEETKNVINYVTSDSSLAETVFNYPEDELSSKEKYAKEIIHDHIIQIQKENDEYIKKALCRIVKEKHQKDYIWTHKRQKDKYDKDGKLLYEAGKTYEETKKNNNQRNGIIEYHFGKAAVNDPYAYKLNIDSYAKAKEEKNGKYEYKVNLSGINNYLSQIDYPASFGVYSIALYSGLDSESSKNWTDYLYNNKDYFLGYLKKLVEGHWKLKLEYNIKTGAGYNSEKSYSFMCENEDQINKSCNFIIKYKKRSSKKNIIGVIDRSELIGKMGEINEKCLMLTMLRELVSEQEYSELIDYIRVYFSRNTSRLIGVFTLILQYKFNDKPVITDEDREKLEETLTDQFRKKTIEGLNLFKSEEDKGIKGLGDIFAEQIFKPKE